MERLRQHKTTASQQITINCRFIIPTAIAEDQIRSIDKETELKEYIIVDIQYTVQQHSSVIT